MAEGYRDPWTWRPQARQRSRPRLRRPLHAASARVKYSAAGPARRQSTRHPRRSNTPRSRKASRLSLPAPPLGPGGRRDRRRRVHAPADRARPVPRIARAGRNGRPRHVRAHRGRLTHFRWSSLPPSRLGPRSRPLLAWTGRELLELGRTSTSNNDTARSGDAAASDPATGHWRSIAHVPNTVGLSGGVTVWTGRQLLVTNGRVPSKFWNAVAGAPAALYDPAANRWSVTDLPVRLLGADQLAAAWTGRSVVVAGVVRRRLQSSLLRPGDQPLARDQPDAARGPPAGRPRHGRHVQPAAPVVALVENHEDLGHKLRSRLRRRCPGTRTRRLDRRHR